MIAPELEQNGAAPPSGSRPSRSSEFGLLPLRTIFPFFPGHFERVIVPAGRTSLGMENARFVRSWPVTRGPSLTRPHRLRTIRIVPH